MRIACLVILGGVFGTIGAGAGRGSSISNFAEDKDSTGLKSKVKLSKWTAS